MDRSKISLLIYFLISQFREGIHNNTKHNVQTNGGHNDEES